MRYFHRTSLDPDGVLAEADAFFGTQLEEIERGERSRAFRGSIGTITLTIRAEGGHYTHVSAVTDQVAESELDKLTKRFLGLVHQRADPSHQVRGAY